MSSPREHAIAFSARCGDDWGAHPPSPSGEAMNALSLRTLLVSASALTIAAFAGCGGSTSSQNTGGSNSTGTHGEGASHGSGGKASGSGGGDFVFDAGAGDGSIDPDAACAAQSASATLTKKPVDVIIVIDNSGSMTEEIVGVQQNINQNFAQIIEASGLDYRVILVARHGKASSGQSVCIEAPLSGIPTGGCATPPAQPVNNPPKFYHYSVEIASRDSWCKVLNTYDKPDEFNLAPNGWKEWLRPDSYKTFIEITDDGVGCTFNNVTYQDSNSVAGGTSAAPLFDTALLTLSPEQFGTAAERNYRFYSIIAMGANTPATKPWEPSDPVTTAKCPTAANPGTGHQALSVLTGGLRFPICDTTSYDVVFQAIADGVIKGAKVACEFPVPDAPPGKTIDLATVQVAYTPGGAGPATTFGQVSNAAACIPDRFYIENDTIKLCPDACSLVQADDKAKIDVVFGCGGKIN
ncbi:Hypothetical protein A7982_05600 [Minicystis rosea]|nr:Hypothetical protein A7982_05600 [Minicystis rosea]